MKEGHIEPVNLIYAIEANDVRVLLEHRGHLRRGLYSVPDTAKRVVWVFSLDLEIAASVPFTLEKVGDKLLRSIAIFKSLVPELLVYILNVVRPYT